MKLSQQFIYQTSVNAIQTNQLQNMIVGIMNEIYANLKFKNFISSAFPSQILNFLNSINIFLIARDLKVPISE